MSSHVPLQFVSVPAGVAAQAALEWALSGVRANVTFQLADLKPKNAKRVSDMSIKAALQREFPVNYISTKKLHLPPPAWYIPCII